MCLINLNQFSFHSFSFLHAKAELDVCSTQYSCVVVFLDSLQSAVELKRERKVMKPNFLQLKAINTIDQTLFNSVKINNVDPKIKETIRQIQTFCSTASFFWFTRQKLNLEKVKTPFFLK